MAATTSPSGTENAQGPPAAAEALKLKDDLAAANNDLKELSATIHTIKQEVDKVSAEEAREPWDTAHQSEHCSALKSAMEAVKAHEHKYKSLVASVDANKYAHLEGEEPNETHEAILSNYNVYNRERAEMGAQLKEVCYQSSQRELINEDQAREMYVELVQILYVQQIGDLLLRWLQKRDTIPWDENDW
ncbi:hypothetical protein BU26DRAFT_577896 [Trematosphaeria pertusa]|uniref:Uncharacterized protein n=1 Tax=Trematosphaeria pertusa TaxID=390896 RepID=A0A6A6I7H3_9PLEO|nr:uncharacterized protein BU26DRAFT_577896 [Trematosphaeria pertusa]KAF2246296.1 hypothetical protein BU26DRAFT_577896 [Trematosphaeria pertusa]